MDGGSHVNYLNCCFASIAILTWLFLHSYAHKNSNAIPALSEF